jgi:NADPH-dependent 2,4-dienoyl-CoA reductase/sulfur reductase-like enzyme
VSTCAELGLAVTVVEREAQVLPGWHPATVTSVMETLQRRGVRVITSAAVERAEPAPGSTDRVGSITTAEGSIETDLVLVATGVRPEAGLAEAAGLRTGPSGAIWVNQYLQTSCSSIWAAGDCAEAYHRLLRKNSWVPLGTTANKQGRIAGANATGAKERFRGIVGTAGFVVFDLEVARTGLSEEVALAEGFEPVSVTVKQRSRAHGLAGGVPIQVTLVADRPTGILLGAEICGREGAALRINVLATALALPMTVADLQGLDLVYAPPFAPVWDPILVAANQLIKKTGRKP